MTNVKEIKTNVGDKMSFQKKSRKISEKNVDTLVKNGLQKNLTKKFLKRLLHEPKEKQRKKFFFKENLYLLPDHKKF